MVDIGVVVAPIRIGKNLLRQFTSFPTIIVIGLAEPTNMIAYIAMNIIFSNVGPVHLMT